MSAILRCIRRDQIDHILQAHQFDVLDVNAWYPITEWLAVLTEIERDQATMTENLVAIGLKYIETSLSPGELDSFDDALIALNDAYQLNHRAGYVGEFSIVIYGPGKIEVIDNTPYPEDFIYGLIYGTARQYEHHDAFPTIERLYADEDDTPAYSITW